MHVFHPLLSPVDVDFDADAFLADAESRADKLRYVTADASIISRRCLHFLTALIQTTQDPDTSVQVL